MLWRFNRKDIAISYKYGYKSVVLSPGMVALGAPEKPHLALISSAELAEPPDCQIVCTFGTLDLDSRHGLHLFLFVIDDPDLPLLADSTCVSYCQHLQFSVYNRISGISADPRKILTYFYTQDKTWV